MTARLPAAYVFGRGDGSHVIVPGRIAALLVQQAGLNDLRQRMRGLDGEFDSVLEGIVMSAVEWRQGRGLTSDIGSDQDERGGSRSSSSLTTAEAAALLGITPRAVRLAIRENRLEGRPSGGVWLVDREDVEHFRSARTQGGME